MSKRSAFSLAGGLAAAILAIVIALSTLDFAGRSAAPASAAVGQKPIVRTITQTVTIHRKAPAKPGRAGASGLDADDDHGGHGGGGDDD